MASNRATNGSDETGPTPSQMLQLDIDMRLGAELWAQVWEATDWTDEAFAAFLRFAYGRGYQDALTEPRRGQLCLDHGLVVPRRERTAS